MFTLARGCLETLIFFSGVLPGSLFNMVLGRAFYGESLLHIIRAARAPSPHVTENII